MIEKLRYKFIIITMGSVFFVMAGILLALNGFNYIHARNRADEVLEVLAENDGSFPQLEGPRNNFGPGNAINSETPFETRFFKVIANEEGEILQIDTSRVRSVDSELAQSYGEAVLTGDKEKGYLDDFRYWKVIQEEGTQLLLFVDNYRELETFRSFLRNSIFIGIASLFMILLLVVFFSKKIVAPVQENLDKQKRFITDAGHEIKTPLSIISANNDVQELIDGQSEWTQSTRNQIVRLNRLVEEMLSLARMEEGSFIQKMESIELSKVVREEITPFQLLCEQEGISFSTSIEESIVIQGEKESLRKVCSTLLDNAQKYVTEKGMIQVELKKEKKKVVLSVSNSVDSLPEKLDRLFDRFYRESESRNQRVGGYGIGLSLAQAIVGQHWGTIEASSPSSNQIQFNVRFPL